MFSRPTKYYLRWCFDYPNKASIRGMWSQTSNNPVDQAWNKVTGASRMKIEAKDVDTKHVKVLADVPADDFRTFKWMATAKVGGFAIRANPIHQLIGLEMWTANNSIKAYDDGTVKITKLKPEEMNMNLATYGK